MKKKLLTLIPALLLIASCSAPQTSSEPIPSNVPSGAKEVDVYVSEPAPGAERKATALSSNIKKAAAGFEDANGYLVNETLNLSAGLSLRARVAENPIAAFLASDPTTIEYTTAGAEANAALTETSEIGLAGFNALGASFSDLVAYASFNQLSASLGLEYNIPEIYLALLFKGESPLATDGVASYNLVDPGVKAYLKDSNAYLSANDQTLKTFYNTVMNTSFVDFTKVLPSSILVQGEGETLNVPSYEELLNLLGLNSLKAYYPIAPELVDSFNVNNLNIYKAIPQSFLDDLTKIDDFVSLQQDLLKALNFRAFTYDDNSDYLLSLSFEVNKSALASIYDSFAKIEERDTFDEFLVNNGVTINTFLVNVEANFSKNGKIDLSASFSIDVRVDATKIVTKLLAKYLESLGLGVDGLDAAIDKIFKSATIGASFNASLALSAEKVSPTIINSKIPTDLSTYQNIKPKIDELIESLTPAEQAEAE